MSEAQAGKPRVVIVGGGAGGLELSRNPTGTAFATGSGR